MTRLDLDAFDRRLLAALQADNQVPAERLSEMVGLSPSSVQRRTRRLREGGVILRDVSIIDPHAVGQPVTAIVEVTLERDAPQFTEAFRRRMRAAPEVQQCYAITGDGDFLLIVTAADVADYQEIIERLLAVDPNIRRFRTSVVTNRVKASLAVAIS